ncbi:hypothetical protein HDU91_004242 [Kappamyces sp. JEL0680]|nr:hypothetical protein HDU91_004242 [Kappamyces sp. JEL0680]
MLRSLSSLLLLSVPAFAAGNVCEGTAQLCLDATNVETNKAFTVYWNAGQVPLEVQPASMTLNLYGGDLAFVNIVDPCHVDSQSVPLIASFPVVPHDSRMENVGASSITIPSSSALETYLAAGSNKFFLQLGNPANVNCQLGPRTAGNAVTFLSITDSPPAQTGNTSTLSTSSATSASTGAAAGAQTGSTAPSGSPASHPTSADETAPRGLGVVQIILLSLAALVLLILLLLVYVKYFRKTTVLRNPEANVSQGSNVGLVGMRQTSQQTLAVRTEPAPAQISALPAVVTVPEPRRPTALIATLTLTEAEAIGHAFKQALNDPISEFSDSP